MDLSRVSAYSPAAAAGGGHEAAVLAPVIDRGGEPHLLFTKRAEHLGEHPGQMSFPGGGREPHDESLVDTATREAHEEIGLRPDEVDLVGRLDVLETVTRYAVTPFVSRAPDRDYEPDEREVAEIAVLPVAALVDPGNYEHETREHPEYGEVRVHYFHVNGYTVWGATAQILAQLLAMTTNWQPPGPVDRVLDADGSRGR